MLLRLVRESEYRMEGYVEELRKGREDAERWLDSVRMLEVMEDSIMEDLLKW